MNPSFLQALYKWSVENSDSQIFKNLPPEKIMSPERRAWLEEAFDALIKDGYTLMKDMLSFIEDPTTNDTDRITAIRNLEELLENIDNASNFHKLNGWDIMVKYSKSRNIPLAAAAISCIGAGLQNHPDATLKATESGIMNVIRHISTTSVNSMQPGYNEYVRAVSALTSSLLRGDMKIRIEAIRNGANRILINVLNIRPISMALQQRAVHVLSFISSEQHIHSTREAQQEFRNFVHLLWTRELINTLTALGKDAMATRDPSLQNIVEYVKTILKNINK